MNRPTIFHKDVDRKNAIDLLKFKLTPTEYRPIESLKPYRKTLRKHPESQLVKLTAAICKFGFLRAVLIDEDGTIIAGAALVEAAKRAGLTEVPVTLISHLSKAEVRALRVADNRLGDLSTFDTDALATEMAEILSIEDLSAEAIGWETAELDLLLETAAVPAPADADPADVVPELPTRPSVRGGELWQLGHHRLLCDTSLEPSSWVRLMAGAVAAAAFNDPPYNVPILGHVSGLGAKKHGDFAMASGEMTKPDFIAFNRAYLTNMIPHLADGAVIYVCIDWRHVLEVLTAATEADFSLINMCVWNKTNGGMGSLYRSKHELIPVLKKGRIAPINNVQLGATGRYRTNVWDYAGANSFGPSRMDDLRDHPTVKPTALVADAIRDVSHRNQIVIDAFVGSGTTILAAERTGRRAYGIELEPGYVEIALRRWMAMTGREPVLEATGETFSEVERRRAGEPAAADSRPGGAYPDIVPRPRQRRAA